MAWTFPSHAWWRRDVGVNVSKSGTLSASARSSASKAAGSIICTLQRVGSTDFIDGPTRYGVCETLPHPWQRLNFFPPPQKQSAFWDVYFIPRLYISRS